MKIEDKDIIRTAQQLRDEQNAQFRVRPWNRHSQFYIPTWLVAIPAAAIIGFVLGIWTNVSSPKEAQLTALVDTVILAFRDFDKNDDGKITNHEFKYILTHVGDNKFSDKEADDFKMSDDKNIDKNSIADDKIRYDLLVKN